MATFHWPPNWCQRTILSRRRQHLPIVRLVPAAGGEWAQTGRAPEASLQQSGGACAASGGSAKPEAPQFMKLLISSPDLDDLGQVVKRLVCACIPCAVCKDPVSSHLSVWIQQDIDFPLALRVVMNRDKRSGLPHWARVYEAASPAANMRAGSVARFMRRTVPTPVRTAPQPARRCPTPESRPVVLECRPLLRLTR